MLVYSTDSGRMCPACGQPVAQCTCKQHKPAAATDGVVRVSRERQGRGGKVVTVVRGLGLDEAAMTALSKRLKALCGSGGTLKDGVIEVQGDHVARVMDALAQARHTVKRAGG